MADMDSLTYARSAAGQKKLLADLNGDIDNAVRALTGTEYQSLMNVVQQYWVGVDEQKFEKVLRESVALIGSKFKTYKNVISTALTQDAAQFSSMQKQNADSINKINV